MKEEEEVARWATIASPGEYSPLEGWQGRFPTMSRTLSCSYLSYPMVASWHLWTRAIEGRGVQTVVRLSTIAPEGASLLRLL